MVLTNPPFTLFLGRGQDSVSQGISLLIIGCGVQGGPGTMNMCVYVYLFMFLCVCEGGREGVKGGSGAANSNNIHLNISFDHKNVFFLKQVKQLAGRRDIFSCSDANQLRI